MRSAGHIRGKGNGRGGAGGTVKCMGIVEEKDAGTAAAPLRWRRLLRRDAASFMAGSCASENAGKREGEGGESSIETPT
jgi:hypothetical protein